MNVGTICGCRGTGRLRDHRQGGSCQHRRRLPSLLRHHEALSATMTWLHWIGCWRRSPRARASSSSSTASTAWAATSRRCRRSCRSVKKYGARLMVDDAHAMGVLGRRARDRCSLRHDRGGRSDHGHVQQVVCLPRRLHRGRRRSVIDYIQHHARSLIFSASIPPANAAAALAALEVMEAEPERVDAPHRERRIHARRLPAAGLRHRRQSRRRSSRSSSATTRRR